MRFLFPLLLLAFAPVAFTAGTWKSKGEVSIETRQFDDDGSDLTEDSNYGLFTRLETRWRQGPWRFQVRGFGRIDRTDESRDLAAFEEAWFGYRKSGWDIRAGFQMLNWTATEAFHPADVMNSRNLDSNIENPEKLGELMLSVSRRIGQGSLTLYGMPRYEEPVFAESSSRLSFIPAGFTVLDPIWLEDNGKIASDSYGEQYGLRFTQTIGDADIGIHYLDHMDRQFPLFQVDAQTGSIQPIYLRVEDLGLTYSHVLGSWLLKVEYAYKDFQDQTSRAVFAFNQVDHQQAAFGLEYGWNGSSGSETTLIIEGQTLLDATEQERSQLSAFQRDALLGVRHAWNDVMGRELLVTLIGDLEKSEQYLLNLSYTQRLSDTWSIETGLRYIEAEPEPGRFPEGLENLDQADQVFLTISKFF